MLKAHSGYDKLRVVQELLKATGNEKMLAEIESRIPVVPDRALIRKSSSTTLDGADMQKCMQLIDGLTTSVNALKDTNKSLNFAMTEMRTENDALLSRMSKYEEEKVTLAAEIVTLKRAVPAPAAGASKDPQAAAPSAADDGDDVEVASAQAQNDVQLEQEGVAATEVAGDALPAAPVMLAAAPSADGGGAAAPSADGSGAIAPVQPVLSSNPAEEAAVAGGADDVELSAPSNATAPPADSSLGTAKVTAAPVDEDFAPLEVENLDQFGFATSDVPSPSQGGGQGSGADVDAGEGADADSAEVFGGFGNLVEVAGVAGMEL